jgi:ribosomal protein S18 acetylase RimI-like enzyme
MAPEFSVKIGPQELDRLISGRKSLDDCHLMATYAARYHELGWEPVILTTDSQYEVAVNFSEPPASWDRVLMGLALKGVRLTLAIRPHRASLLVIRPSRDALAGPAYYLGNREVCCRARAGAHEQLFFVLPPGWKLEPDHLRRQGELAWKVWGPTSLAPAPPTRNDDAGEAWIWVAPPWEQPPTYPGPRVLSFLEERGVLRRDRAAALPAQIKQLAALPQDRDRQPAAVGQAGCRQESPAADPALPWWQEWSALLPKSPVPPDQLAEFRGAVRQAVRDHPQVAGSREQVKLVVYCYHHYIAINPHYAGLSYGEKLARALEVMRDFLKA